ncbi:MAG: hypothetical protein AAGF91_04880 [Actinomycetota bacterium]
MTTPTSPRPRRRPLGRLRTLLAAGVIGVLAALLAPGTASAHEFGPFAIDRYIAVLVSPDGLTIDYVMDLAETPTQDLGDGIEADPAGWCDSLLEDVTVNVDGTSASINADAATAERRDGDGGLTTMRIECDWSVELDETADERTIEVDDGNYTERVGWREIVVVGDLTAISGDVSDDTITFRLTDFPDPDENPRTSSVVFQAVASDDVGPGELDDSVPGDDDGGGDMFTNLIADAESGWAMVAALGIAAFLGALHSLAPGHGKTVIGAYLVGTRGPKIQALVLAVAVALSHTLGVLILGIITYIAGAAFAPERVYPWLQGLSAVIVLGIGVWLVWMAFHEYQHRKHDQKASASAGHSHDHALATAGAPATVAATTTAAATTATMARVGHGHSHDHGGHGHSHDDHDHGHSHDDHDHDHSHDHHEHSDDHHDHEHDGHEHSHGDHDHSHNGHSHDHSHNGDAHADHSDHGHSHADHDHSHNGHAHADHDHGDHSHNGHAHADHDHSHNGHSHGNGDHSHDHHSNDHDHDHDHDHGSGWHRHGIFPHTHKFDLDEMDLQGKVSWKTLALLGLTGGLVPSTAAIIVLLGAIQLNRIAFGGILILSFGIGMAIALVSVGLGMVALRDRVFGAMDGNEMIRRARIIVVPLAAVTVFCVGIFLVIRAVTGAGSI